MTIKSYSYLDLFNVTAEIRFTVLMFEGHSVPISDRITYGFSTSVLSTIRLKALKEIDKMLNM